MKIVSKAISAVFAAALVAGAITLLTGASGSVSASAPLHAGKSDRLDIRADAPKCSEQAWPNYDAACLKDRRQSMSEAKPARIITAADHVKVEPVKRVLAKPAATDVSAAKKVAAKKPLY